MNPNLKSAMLAAAQLTAAGNLNAATQAIQRALGGDLPSASASSPFAGATRAAEPDRVIDVEARWVDDLQARLSEVARGAQSAFGAGMLREAGQERPAADASPSERSGAEQMQAGRFTAAAGSRDYLLYVPAQARAGSAGPMPLVVMLHGCTQTPADFATGTAMNELADRHGFVVLYPGQSKAANHSACWNWFEPRDQRAGHGEPSILAGMVRDVIGRHPIAPERVSVAGLSAGGAMAAILGAAYPELFSAVAVHSGLPTGAASDLQSALAAMKRGASPQSAGGGGPRSAEAALRPVRTIVFHGRQDRTVHPANGKQVVEAALSAFPKDALSARQESGRSPGGRSFVRTVHADDRGLPMVEHWEVQGAGHAWSGGRPSGSYTDRAGPDASAAMAAFFLAGR